MWSHRATIPTSSRPDSTPSASSAPTSMSARGAYSSTSEENEYAKVELAAAKYSDEVGKVEVTRVWRQEVFRDARQTVVYEESDATRNALLGLDTREPRFVLAPRRLSLPERHGLYHGMQLRNQIVLLEPRDQRADHLNNPDLIAYGRRLKAAHDLAQAPGTGAERRAKFERIEREQSQNIQRVLKAAGLLYVRIESWAEHPADTVLEEESLGQASSKEEMPEPERPQPRRRGPSTRGQTFPLLLRRRGNSSGRARSLGGLQATARSVGRPRSQPASGAFGFAVHIPPRRTHPDGNADALDRARAGQSLIE
jgi:hypothetical protein